MIVKKTMGFVILTPDLSVSQKGLLDIFIPRTTTSRRWRHWKATIDLKTCSNCLDHHGKVYAVDEHIPQEPPLHPFCRCVVEPMEAIEHGCATHEKENGADYVLFTQGKLPDYYISRAEAIELGWRSSKPLSKFAPGKMLFGGVYFNKDGRLPSAPGRIWWEADLNYYSGQRNGHRIYFSSDGLIFVTYNHGITFYEVV